jgi:hypothetical protein
LPRLGDSPGNQAGSEVLADRRRCFGWVGQACSLAAEPAALPTAERLRVESEGTAPVGTRQDHLVSRFPPEWE